MDTTATPRGPSTSTPRPTPFRCGLVFEGGGRRPAASPISHASRCSPLRFSSAIGQPDLCATRNASTSGSVDTMDNLRCSPPRSSSVVGRPDLHAAPGTSTSGDVDTVDDLLGPTAAGPLLPPHDNGSSCGHQLDHRFWCLQPHLCSTASPHRSFVHRCW
jgi:hypothetical protein